MKFDLPEAFAPIRTLKLPKWTSTSLKLLKFFTLIVLIAIRHPAGEAHFSRQSRPRGRIVRRRQARASACDGVLFFGGRPALAIRDMELDKDELRKVG